MKNDNFVTYRTYTNYHPGKFKNQIMKFEERYASNPEDFKRYDTGRIRKDFLIDNLFKNTFFENRCRLHTIAGRRMAVRTPVRIWIRDVKNSGKQGSKSFSLHRLGSGQ